MAFRKNIALYSIGNLVVALVPFILIPFMTSVFSPSTYGLITMFQVVLGLLNIVIGLSMNGPLLRFNYNKEIDQTKIVNYFYNSWLLYFFSALLIGLVIYWLGEYIEKYFELPLLLLQSAFLSSVLYYPIKIRLGQWQVHGNAKKYVSLQLFQSIFLVSLFFAFYFFIYKDEKSRIYSHIVALIPLFLASLWSLHKCGFLNVGRLSFDDMRDILKQSIGVMPHLFGIYVVSFSDRFIVNKYLGSDIVGVLMLSIQISLVLNIILDGVNKAANPALFRALRDNDIKKKEKFANWTIIYIISLLFSTIPIYYMASYLILNFTSVEYHGAVKLVKFAIVTQIVNGIYLAFVNYIVYSKKLWLLSLISIASGSIGVILSVIYISDYGVMAVVYSSLLSAIIRAVFVMLISINLVEMPWFNYLRCKN
ncbi:lipopolysaccharide biosynthesis protein [Vibrio furnissii]|uniref:lipopolysaccharide biosynthesis protein n=1 Tax=Vibrio furnissii TaxID=29494 RepID=UPI003751F2DB